MNTLTRTLAGSAICAVAALGSTVAPAGAASPISPSEHDVFVIGPDDGAACSFPIQWDVTTKSGGLDLKKQFISLSPGWSVTLTNLDTGATWTPRGDGTVRFQDMPDGSTLQTLDGVNYAQRLDLQLIGHWTRTFYPDGTVSDWVGSGKIVDICAMLS